MNREVDLKQLAIKARDNAYVPYSHFKVGAVVETTDGEAFTGANIENASYGLTNCAERTAIFKAVSEGKRNLKQIAIVADTTNPVSPCGACRQVMAEFFPKEAKVFLGNLKGDWVETTVGELLPGAFEGGDLNRAKK